jgi:hypothetical protein
MYGRWLTHYEYEFSNTPTSWNGMQYTISEHIEIIPGARMFLRKLKPLRCTGDEDFINHPPLFTCDKVFGDDRRKLRLE